MMGRLRLGAAKKEKAGDCPGWNLQRVCAPVGPVIHANNGTLSQRPMYTPKKQFRGISYKIH